MVLIAFLLAITALVPGAAASNQRAAAKKETVDLQILQVSDWHAQLDPLSVFGVGDVGGAAFLSTYFKQDRAAQPNTLTLTAGDAFGASPPLSSFFNEVPAVLAMNLMGFDADGLGNHNFDRGIAHLQQMIDLAEFPYLSANLENVDENLTGVKPYEIFDMDGLKVAVIGITNPEAPELVFPGNFGTINVSGPVKAAKSARAQARREGANFFVLITHMGVTSFENGQAAGPLIDLANKLRGFDVVLGDHTDMQFEGVINDALVVENRSRGLTYSRINLTVDPRTSGVKSRSVEFVTPLSSAVPPDPAIVEMLAPFRQALAEVFDEVIGEATDLFPRQDNIERLGEVAIGNLVTDSMRDEYGTDLVLTNGGGLRAPIPSSYLPQNTALRRNTPGYAPGPPYDVVIGDVFTVLPFGNNVVTRTVTGSQLYQVLEHGVSAMPAANGRFPQISGFKFTYDVAQPVGSRVVDVTLDDGTPILPDSTVYTLTTNDFLNAGGDGYTMLADGQGTSREVMADVLLEYIREQGTITPTIEGRITRLN